MADEPSQVWLETAAVIFLQAEDRIERRHLLERGFARRLVHFAALVTAPLRDRSDRL
jgi:hypothetical protein